MKYLIVVAHPDDEVLGAGASIYKWTQQGDTVDVCIMSAEAKARAFRPEDNELEDDTHAALAFIGVGKEYEGTFPNIEMNTVSHLKLVQHIEAAIKSRKASRTSSSRIILRTRTMTTCRAQWLARRLYVCSSVDRR